jgi:hypothetical protein
MRRSNVAASIGVLAILAAGAVILLWTHRLAGARSESRRFEQADRGSAESQSIGTIRALGAVLDQNKPPVGETARTGGKSRVRTVSLSLANPTLPSRIMPEPIRKTEVAQPSAPGELPPPRAPSKTLPATAVDNEAREHPPE